MTKRHLQKAEYEAEVASVSAIEKRRQYVIHHIVGELVLCTDGYQYWLPRNVGPLNSQELRWIADELDRRYKEWDEIVKDRLNGSDNKATDVG